MFENAVTAASEVQVEENARRSMRQRGMSARLQDCEVLPINEVNDNGDLVHFKLTIEFKHVKMEEALIQSGYVL